MRLPGNGRCISLWLVMAGSGHPADLVGGDSVGPAIHVFKPHQGNKTWMSVISAGMTTESSASLTQEHCMLEEFKKFALRGTAVDLAIGVIIGAAFGAIVNSLVG